MISVNLLPDIKMNRIQAEHRQRRIGALSVVATLIGIGIPILLIVVWGGQKAVIALTQRGINDKIQKIQNTENLAQELTVQRQLDALPGLYEQRLFYTTFTDLLPRLLPQSASLVGFDVNETGLLTINGEADSVATVNDLVNILANTVLVKGEERYNLVNSVSLTSIQPSEGAVTFGITASIDMELFAKTLSGDIRVGDKIVIPFSGATPSSTVPAGNTLEEQ